MDAALLGFSPPPCSVHLKFFTLGTAWTLVAMTPPGKPPAAARWLEPYGPTSIQIAPGLSPKVLRAQFDKLPERWQKLMGSVAVHYMELTPDGSASVFVEDSPTRVANFVTEMKAGEPKVRARASLSTPERVRLTVRQLDVISLAVALGYYEVPHKLNLRDLAKKLDLSVGATSELLRRGEALIVTGYLDSLAQNQWAGVGATHTPPSPPKDPRGTTPPPG